MLYPHLFSEGRIGTRIVKNRIVASPVGDNMANADGSFSDQSIAFYTEKAKGGVGIVMPGVLIVDYPEGKTTINDQRIDRLEYVKGLRRLADSIHAYGALIIPQLQHSGARVHAFMDDVTPRCVSDVDPETTSIRNCRAVKPQKELTSEEIRALIPKFAKAARYCQIAGCDGVEIHMAHGYLLNEFLSPDTNKRTDEYGGSLENRMRLPLEIVRAVRETCGRTFIIDARIPGAEFVKERITPEECRIIAMRLEGAGCDVLNVSIGMTTDQTKIKEPQGSPQGTRIANAENIKSAVSIPVMTSGVFKEPDFCDRVIADGKIDFILMARQLLCDAYWAEKARAGRVEEIRPCLSCNVGCFDSVDIGLPPHCVLNPVAGHEFDDAALRPAVRSKRVAVIGGGIAGMQAAITAARRGHSVTLFEKRARLGGQMNLACVPPDKDSIRKAADWFAAETKRAGVDVRLNKEIALADLEMLAPDHIIYAAGAQPWSPDIPGNHRAVQSWDVLSGETPLPEDKRVAMIGGGIVGCETALLLEKRGCSVTIIEMLPEAAASMEVSNRAKLMAGLARGEARILVSTRVTSIEGTTVFCERNGEKFEVDADMVILAIGQMPYGQALAKAIREKGYDITVVGNYVAPATFGDATRSAYLAASVI